MTWFDRWCNGPRGPLHSEHEAFKAMLKRAGIHFLDAYACDYSSYEIGIGTDAVHHSASTRGNFSSWKFDQDGRLIKTGLYKNWVDEAELPPERMTEFEKRR